MKTFDEQEKSNGEKFLELLQKADPELYMIKLSLEETGIDPLVIVHVIRALGNLTYGHGYGKVQIYMQAKVITNVESTEKIKIDS